MEEKKDIINRGGEKIVPFQIEEVLLDGAGVQAAVVFGISDEEYGEVPAAVLFPQAGCTINLAEISTLLEKRLAKYKRPRYIEIWEKLPVAESGKVRKAEIQRDFQKKIQERRYGG